MSTSLASPLRNLLSWVLILSLGVGVVAFLYAKGHSVDQNKHAQVLSLFSEVEQADKMLSKVAIETRYGLLRSYDTLVDSTTEVQAISDRLSELLSPLISTSSTFANDWRRLADLMKERVEQIEYFKGVNAVMHNSHSYLPLVINELESLLEDDKKVHELYELVEDLGHHSMLFAIDRDYRQQANMVDVIAKIKALKTQLDLSEERRIPLEEMLQHADIFYKSSLKLDSLLERLQKNPSHDAMHVLKRDYVSWFDRQMELAAEYRLFSTIFSLILVAVVLMQLYRLGRSSLKERLLFEQIGELAYEDNVTKLNNRNHFFETLSSYISKRASGAIILLDINRFRNINQALGPDVGDRVLREIADRLRGLPDDAAAIARLEGNKFAVLLDNLGSRTALSVRLSSLTKALSEPVRIGEQWLDIELTAAGALFPDISADTNVLMRTVEDTLLSAKQRKMKSLVAEQAVESVDTLQLSLFSELQTALDEKQLWLAYQPKVSIKTGKTESVEALIRWQHPEKGAVSPAEFIPFAETTGFIRQMTPWVIKQAAADAYRCYQSGLEIVFSVNISVLDLTAPFFVLKVQDILDEVGLPPHLLCLEVTESALMDDPDVCLNRLHLLRDLGLRLSVDDYGTGHASLSYVRDLPLNELKIDRSFIAGLEVQERNAAIVRSTLMMCRDMQIETVAEGVETMAELDWLQEQGCDLVQGFLLSRPLSYVDLQDWLTQPTLKIQNSA